MEEFRTKIEKHEYIISLLKEDLKDEKSDKQHMAHLMNRINMHRRFLEEAGMENTTFVLP